MTSKRILIVLPNLRGGGVERMRLVLADEFHRRGYSVELALGQRKGELLGKVPDHVLLHDLAAPRLRSMVRPLAALIRERKPLAVLGAMWPLSGLVATAARLSQHPCRVVVSEHNTLSDSAPGTLNRLAMGTAMPAAYMLCDGVVTVTAAVARDLSRLTRLPTSTFTVIHNPAQLHEAPKELAPPTTGKRILTVGTLKEQKDQATLIRSFAAAFPDDTQLVILGEGPLRGSLEQLANELGVSDRVLLPGFDENPGRWYASSDLFVLPSRWEGFGNVLVEALSLGVPVVSSDLPPTREVLEGGKFGRLVEMGNVPAFAEAMKETLDSPPNPDELRAKAADFAPHIIAGRYLKLLAPA